MNIENSSAVKAAQASNKNNQSQAHLSLGFGGYSIAGEKAENQDAFAALIPEASQLHAKGAVAAIADGLSSAEKAAEAAQLAVTQFIQEYYNTPDTWSTDKCAAKVLTSLNGWLFSQGGLVESDKPQWLTTFSTVILKSASAYIFHAGDCRVSRIRQGEIEQLTRDHNRKQGTNQGLLTRALGAEHRLKVDAHKVDIIAGDILMLTCDGVHDFVSKKAIKSVLDDVSIDSSREQLEQKAKQIVELALKNGSDDNLTCLLVNVAATPARKIEEIERDLLSMRIPPALSVGQKLDDYEVKKVLHASIRSHLYLVEQISTGKPYVLKAPSANFSDDAIYLQGFLREAWVGERIRHTNVMQVQNAPSDSMFVYHICEFIDGQTLTDWMHDNPKPSLAAVRDIIKQVISALRAFQRMQLVHRDLKPDNIMIDKYGHVKLIDYGTVYVASLAENQDVLVEEVPQGSLNYIAPETLLHLQADHQSDLFSLGVICYEMLTGELPYKPMKRAEVEITDYSDLIYRPIKQFRPELPFWLELCLKQATNASPNGRYQAYSEFFEDLSKPNLSAVDEYKSQPILERDPVKFWQGVSALLAVALICSLVL